MSDHPVLQPGQPTPPSLTAPSVPSPPSPGITGNGRPSSFDHLADRPVTAPIVTQWGAEVSYESFQGIGKSPLAGPPGTPFVATWVIHQPYTLKTVSFVCQAIGGNPELPSSDTYSDNEQLLYTRLAPQVPQVNQDGLPIWTVTGEYVYVLYITPGDTDTLGIGSHPLSVLPPELNTLNVGDFKHMLAAAVVSFP